MDLGGIDLVTATAQPVTCLEVHENAVYLFMRPEGMQAQFIFEQGVKIDGRDTCRHSCRENARIESFLVEKDGREITIMLLDRKMTDQMFICAGRGLVFTEGALLQNENGISLEIENAVSELLTYPTEFLQDNREVQYAGKVGDGILGLYHCHAKEKSIIPKIKKVAFGRYEVRLPDSFMDGLKDARLQVYYTGDIGQAFLDGRLVHDNFCNGEVWEIGLREIEDELNGTPMTIYITPIKEGANVNVESAMAARLEEVGEKHARLEEVRVLPVYEIALKMLL